MEIVDKLSYHPLSNYISMYIESAFKDEGNKNEYTLIISLCQHFKL